TYYCFPGYFLNTDGNCYPQTNQCPPEYFLNVDGLCHPTHPVPCPFASTTTTTTTTEPTTTTTTTEPTTTTTTTEPTTTTTTTEPTTTTTTTEPTTTTTTTEPTTTTTTTEPTTTTTTTEPTTTTTTTEEIPLPPPVEYVRCPPDSIFYEEQCRKIVCSEGEYYAGRCISPACPPGTVWHGRRCQEPGYITTILEIGNVVHNEHRYNVTSENINRVEYVTPAPYNPDTDNSYEATPPSIPEDAIVKTSTRRPWIYPSLVPTTTERGEEAFPGSRPPSGCCVVKSPRICVNYSPNWVCSSKDYKLCDPRVCTSSVIYLKPPQVVETEHLNRKMVVMPPNPPLVGCSTPDCKESDVLDCSGCKDHLRDKCSPGCYSYFCPNGFCGFMNTQDFCEIYPGEFGCNPNDGCIWDWCNKKCY
ncbi:hypothetical protein KR038_000479, partial [Drosophila bunnanda]